MHKTTFPPITETTLDCNWYQLEFVDDQGEQVHEVPRRPRNSAVQFVRHGSQAFEPAY